MSLSFLDVFANTVGMLLLLIVTVMLVTKALLSPDQVKEKCQDFEERKKKVAEVALSLNKDHLMKEYEELEQFMKKFDASDTETLVANIETALSEEKKSLSMVGANESKARRSMDDQLLESLPAVLGVNVTQKKAMLGIVRSGRLECYVVGKNGVSRAGQNRNLSYDELLDEINFTARKDDLYVLLLVASGQMGAAWKVVKDLRGLGVDCALEILDGEWEVVVRKLEAM